jgi:hypothetical protein
MKKFLFSVLFFVSVIINMAYSQEAKDLPRLYWGMYHSDIDNDYLNKTSITRWTKAAVPFRIITTQNATEIKVEKIEVTIAKPKSNKLAFTCAGNIISEEMKQALLAAATGDMITITAYYNNDKGSANIQLMFAVE